MAPGTQGHAGSGSSGRHQDHPNQHDHGKVGGHGGVDHRRDDQHAGGSGLDVSPEAVPALRSTFYNALTKVDRQIELANNDLRLTSWARDPISQDATELFNDRSVNPGGSALDMLRAYRSELEAAVAALDGVTQQYRVMEQDNSVTVSQQPGGAA